MAATSWSRESSTRQSRLKIGVSFDVGAGVQSALAPIGQRTRFGSVWEEKTMTTKQSAFAAMAGATCALATLTTAHHASACGGCFHPPAQVASDITDERMLLSVSQTQTTLFDQIKY